MENIEDVLLKLSKYSAVGTLTDAADYAAELLSEFCECSRKGLSVIGTMKGNCDYTVLLDAHIDEVAMIVTDVADNGFLTVEKCGGIDLRTLPSRPVTVHGKEKVTAVFCSTPPHLNAAEQEFKSISEIKLDSMLGAKAKDVIAVGDYVTYATSPVELRNGRISGKSLDNRAGVACLLELARRLKDKRLPFNVTFVLSDSEELGLRGAKTAAFSVNPEESVVVDVSFGDGPDISPSECGKLGDGTMIGISPSLDSAIYKKLIETAKDNGIKYQTEIMGGATSTNADVVSVTRCGVRTGLLSIPLRNMHTETEIVDIKDLYSLVDILENYILSGGVKNV